MAKYRVRKGDNPLKLASQFGISPQKLLQSNGIQSLTAGQTIKIPSGNATGTLGLRSNNPVAFNGLNVPSSFPTTSNYPYQPPNGFPSPTPAPFMTQSMLTPPPTPSLVSLTNGQTTPQGQGALALGANTYIPPNTGIPQNQTITPNQNTTQPATTSTLPTNYVYTGGNSPEAIEQRRIWNIQAGGTGDEQVRLLSREDVWNRKANQRRKQMGRGGGGVVPVVAPESVTGNASNVSLSWRVG